MLYCWTSPLYYVVVHVGCRWFRVESNILFAKPFMHFVYYTNGKWMQVGDALLLCFAMEKLWHTFLCDQLSFFVHCFRLCVWTIFRSSCLASTTSPTRCLEMQTSWTGWSQLTLNILCQSVGTLRVNLVRFAFVFINKIQDVTAYCLY